MKIEVELTEVDYTVKQVDGGFLVIFRGTKYLIKDNSDLTCYPPIVRELYRLR